MPCQIEHENGRDLDDEAVETEEGIGADPNRLRVGANPAA